jgi:hypothetical protein
MDSINHPSNNKSYPERILNGSHRIRAIFVYFNRSHRILKLSPTEPANTREYDKCAVDIDRILNGAQSIPLSTHFC